jgi:hypothetical protein
MCGVALERGLIPFDSFTVFMWPHCATKKIHEKKNYCLPTNQRCSTSELHQRYMNTKRDSKKAAKTNGGYDYVYRFRTHRTLKKRAERVAEARGFGDAADIGREGVIKLIEAEEKRLKLPTLQEAAA